MNKIITNEFGIPFYNGRYYYPDEAPQLPALVVFDGILYEDLFYNYVSRFDGYTSKWNGYETALKQYIFYYSEAPIFQTPKILMQKFRKNFSSITPAEMLLDLMDYGITPYEI
jgi:hypothetical protein